MPAAKPPEFRRRAVELARQREKPIAQIAHDLGIAETCLRRWMKQDDVDTGRAEGVSTDERAELVRPGMANPVPKGREARWRTAGERSGMLAHTVRRPKNRSSLRLREPRRLPTALSKADAAELLASFRTWRDRAIAG